MNLTAKVNNRQPDDKIKKLKLVRTSENVATSTNSAGATRKDTVSTKSSTSRVKPAGARLPVNEQTSSRENKPVYSNEASRY